MTPRALESRKYLEERAIFFDKEKENSKSRETKEKSPSMALSKEQLEFENAKKTNILEKIFKIAGDDSITFDFLYNLSLDLKEIKREKPVFFTLMESIHELVLLEKRKISSLPENKEIYLLLSSLIKEMNTQKEQINDLEKNYNPYIFSITTLFFQEIQKNTISFSIDSLNKKIEKRSKRLTSKKSEKLTFIEEEIKAIEAQIAILSFFNTLTTNLLLSSLKAKKLFKDKPESIKKFDEIIMNLKHYLKNMTTKSRKFDVFLG